MELMWLNDKRIMNLYGEKCSTIISRLTNEVVNMKKGDVITLKTDSICACKKIPGWCRLNNYKVGIQKIDKNCMHFKIRVWLRRYDLLALILM